MEISGDLTALQRCLAEVPRRGREYTSTLFASPTLLSGWWAEGTTRAMTGSGAVLVMRAQDHFHRLYHVSADFDSLTAVLRTLSAGTYVADLVGQPDKVDCLCTSYAQAGFALHGTLIRMSRSQQSETPGEGDVDIADTADAEGIASFLGRLLDPFVDQIPDIEEIQRSIAAGEVLLTRHTRHRITGLLMYERQAQSAHLRYWYVDRGEREAGIGRRLMIAFLNRCASVRRIVLWVVADNSRSIAIYRHYGFAPDGLVDRIMILNKEDCDE